MVDARMIDMGEVAVDVEIRAVTLAPATVGAAVLDSFEVSGNGDYIAPAVSVPIDMTCADGATVDVDVTLTQKDLFRGSSRRSISRSSSDASSRRPAATRSSICRLSARSTHAAATQVEKVGDPIVAAQWVKTGNTKLAGGNLGEARNAFQRAVAPRDRAQERRCAEEHRDGRAS